jgi:uncharacterized membrane protein YgcG
MAAQCSGVRSSGLPSVEPQARRIGQRGNHRVVQRRPVARVGVCGRAGDEEDSRHLPLRRGAAQVGAKIGRDAVYVAVIRPERGASDPKPPQPPSDSLGGTLSYSGTANAVTSGARMTPRRKLMILHRLAPALTCLALLVPGEVQAHWCDDLWISNYNLVIRPVSDSVSVPSSGSATLDIFVQNNMGYPLKNFDLKATATGYTVKVTRQAPKVSGFLMPGEKLKHTLTISKSGGGNMTVADLSFSVTFGTGSQSARYPSGGGKAAMLQKADGSLVPAPPPPGINPNNRVKDGIDQSAHLLFSSQADYSTLSSALDNLMKQYCVGRPGWDHNSYTGPTSNCSNVSDASTFKCATASPGNGTTKYDWQRLWSSMELAYRKSHLGDRLAPFRKGLQCGWNDNNFAFKSFAGFVLGYLGDDAGSRSFLEGIVSSGTADEKAVAKAALLMMGGDASKYHADVDACASSSNVYVAAVCQSSLAIVDKNDAIVSSKLLPKISWTEPDTSANGNGLFQAHLVALVAWDRRQWAPNAGDTGQVCFYENCSSSGSSSGGSSGSSSGSSGGSGSGSGSSSGGSGSGSDTALPAAPANVTCTGTTERAISVSWPAVTKDERGQSENGVSYKVYYGNQPRSAGATTKNDFAYAHSDATTVLSKEYKDMDGSKTYYFSVVAVDAAGLESRYSNEVSCVPGVAGSNDSGGAPNCALATVTPTSGKLPLKIKLDASKCTPTGSSFYWRIPTKWVAIEAESSFDTATAEFTFPVEAGPGPVEISLRATANGMEETFPFTVTLQSGGDSSTEGGCSMGGGGLFLAGSALALFPFLRRRRRP